MSNTDHNNYSFISSQLRLLRALSFLIGFALIIGGLLNTYPMEKVRETTEQPITYKEWDKSCEVDDHVLLRIRSIDKEYHCVAADTLIDGIYNATNYLFCTMEDGSPIILRSEHISPNLLTHSTAQWEEAYSVMLNNIQKDGIAYAKVIGGMRRSTQRVFDCSYKDIPESYQHTTNNTQSLIDYLTANYDLASFSDFPDCVSYPVVELLTEDLETETITTTSEKRVFHPEPLLGMLLGIPMIFFASRSIIEEIKFDYVRTKIERELKYRKKKVEEEINACLHRMDELYLKMSPEDKDSLIAMIKTVNEAVKIGTPGIGFDAMHDILNQIQTRLDTIEASDPLAINEDSKDSDWADPWKNAEDDSL